MMSSVPQFIDVEDKIAGPLTWKQLGWMIGMGAVLMLLFTLLDKVLAIILAIPTVFLFLALAFYKPNGMPMISFIMHSFFFMFRPKVAVWERPTPQMVVAKPRSVDQDVVAPQAAKELNHDTLRELARIMDSQRGNER